MVIIPTGVLYRSRRNYQQLWLSPQKKKQQAACHQQLPGPGLVPRREVEFLSQANIQQVLLDIREVEDIVGKVPMSKRMISLMNQRKGKKKQRGIDQYTNKKKYLMDLPTIET